MSTVIVVGPQGCGKSVQAAQLQKHFGVGRVDNEWYPGEPVRPDTLHLTCEQPDEKQACGAQVVAFAALVSTGVVTDMRPAHLRRVGC